MDDSNSDWDSLPHEEQGKKKGKQILNQVFNPFVSKLNQD